jgi:uncharacterized protein
MTPVPPTPAARAGTAEWPYDSLDIAALRARGWRPTALGEFVLKVHQLCNLACDYCYVYTLADQSWRERPKIMSRPVWSAAARRIAEHAERHSLTEVAIVLHGGEPLLAGPDRLAAIATAVRQALPATTTVRITIQTNGVLLTERALRVLASHGIRVGISLDGPAADNDRHRRHVDGRGSHAEVRRALALLTRPEHRRIFAGFLCTIDLASDPVVAYESLIEYAPPAVDFLLPHANWSTSPRCAEAGVPAYGEWLVRLFDRWFDAPRKETRIRFLEEIISLVLGGASRSDQVGLSPSAVAVVETDGTIEQTDSLKSAYEGAAATGLSVLTDPFDAALAHPGLVARQLGTAALCESCINCRIHRICGGGHYAHRYRAGSGFRNPSVYCADLQRIIGHVRRRVSESLHSQQARGRS